MAILTLDPGGDHPGPPWTAILETPLGRVYLTTDPDFRADDGPVLTRAEIDGLLSLVCRIAPPDYLRLTLWRELRALVALKRLLPEAAVATFHLRAPARVEPEQLELLE